MKIPQIKIVGVGGAGNNALSRLANQKIPGSQRIAVNTDSQDLAKTRADFKLRIGRQTTQGLGTGMNPELGRLAALEQKEEIKEILKDSDLVFLVAALGGGTGTGASAVIAQICQELGILSCGIITNPFSFEGGSRQLIAREGMKNLENWLDTLIVVSNDRLISLVEKNTTLTKAFFLADEILRQSLTTITDLLLRPALIPLSFADLKTVLCKAGRGFFGQGTAFGQNRAQEASLKALSSPLLETAPSQASRALFNVSARSLKLAEVEAVASLMVRNIRPEARVIFGAREDRNLKSEEMKVTLIATGF